MQRAARDVSPDLAAPVVETVVSTPDPPKGGPSLESIEASAASERRLVARAGASVTLREDDSSSSIEVRDASARLVFELDLNTGRAVLSAPGDLALAAGGDVSIEAGGTLRCAAKDVEIAARGEAPAKLELGGGALRLSARYLRALADRADLALRDTRMDVARLDASIGEGKVTATRLETAADRIFEQARNVFRTVEDLHQVVAGRTREIVKHGMQIKAGHVAVDADDDVKIDGKSIHLG